MPICKNNNSNNNTNNRGDNLNLDCYHDKILSQIEKNEDKIPDYLGTIEKLKQDLNSENRYLREPLLPKVVFLRAKQ